MLGEGLALLHDPVRKRDSGLPVPAGDRGLLRMGTQPAGQLEGVGQVMVSFVGEPAGADVLRRLQQALPVLR